MPVETNRKPSKRAEVDAHDLDDDLVLYDAANQQGYIFNATAGALWDYLDGTHSLETIADEMASYYGIPYEQALGDVMEFITELDEAGLIQDSVES